MNKNNIVIIILLILLAFSFYLNYQKINGENFQNKDEGRITFDRKMECQAAGEKIYQKHISEGNKSKYLNPEYKYNQKLETCLYSGGRIGDSAGNIQKWVIDSLTNEELVSYIEVDGKPFVLYCDSCKATVEDFNLEKERLFQQ